MTRYVTADDPPRDRFGLYRLCHCLTCEGRGQVIEHVRRTMPKRDVSLYAHGGSRGGITYTSSKRCPDCRSEGRTLQEVASCESAKSLGVALVTLAREDEFSDCPIGVLDREPPCERCGGSGEELNTYQGHMVACVKCTGSGIKPTGTWLVKPWLPSPRNASDAGRLLRSRREDVKA